MADFSEQIPKLLAARRKAAAAALRNAAANSTYWTVLRAIANHFRLFAREAVTGGCTFPDCPITLSTEESGLLNFGLAPGQLRGEMAWKLAEDQNHPPPAVKHPPLPREAIPELHRHLTRVANAFAGANRHARVYSLEPWLQDIYRDRLDIDYAEDLQRQIDRHEADMDSVPRRVRATGLPPNLAGEVVDAFMSFKTITRSAHMLEREKQSFVDRRRFASTATQIESVLARADQALGAGGQGSAARELFSFWKNANFEVMKLTGTLREVWGGTNLDERIQELLAALDAVLSTAARAGDDATPPLPSCPLLSADDMDGLLSQREVVGAFETLMAFDGLFAVEPGAVLTEMRRFGPLSLLFVPGYGRPRYSVELRKTLLAADPEARTKTKSPDPRDLDVERRVRYPANMIVVPLRPGGDDFDASLAEAWFEWKALARAKPLKDALDDLRHAVPAIFEWPADKGPTPPNHARRQLGRHVAAFAAWMRSGQEPDAEALPAFGAFADWLRARLQAPECLVPLRHRAAVEAFRGLSAKRRDEAWARRLGPRYGLDRQALALALLRRDWHGFAGAMKWLSPSLRHSPLVERALAAPTGRDLYNDRDRKADALLRKFMDSDPELKAALVSMETQVAIELDTLRVQMDGLGKHFDYDHEIVSVLQRISTQIQRKRLEINRRLDLYEIGLLYAADDNLAAAVETLTECLTAAKSPAPAEEDWKEVGEEWFEERFQPLQGKFARRPVPGEDETGGTDCVDYIFYNLGRLYLRMDNKYEALLCFSEFAAQAGERGWHYFGLLARGEYERLKAELLAPSPAGAVNATA